MKSVLVTLLTIGLLSAGSESRGFEQDFTTRENTGVLQATNTSNESHRLVWEQGQRLCRFADKGEEGWVELDKDGNVFLQFKELRRNIDFVELSDQKRGYVLRLYKDALFIKGGNKDFHKFEDFTLFYDGQWVK